MSQNIVAYSLVGMFFTCSLLEWNTAIRIIISSKLIMLKLCKKFFFYIKQKPLQPSIASFSSSSLSQMPLYQAPIKFFLSNPESLRGGAAPMPPPGYASAVYLSETGKVQKNMYEIKIIKLERRSIMIYLC